MCMMPDVTPSMTLAEMREACYAYLKSAKVNSEKFKNPDLEAIKDQGDTFLLTLGYDTPRVFTNANMFTEALTKQGAYERVYQDFVIKKSDGAILSMSASPLGYGA